MEIVKNMSVELTIDTIVSDGNGLGRLDGMAVFVPYSAVGDRLKIKIVKVTKACAYGIIEEILQPGAGRTTPNCPQYGKCGGCDLRHLTYDAELAAKRVFVEDAMRRIGKIDFPVAEVLPSLQTDGYRNKVQVPLALDESGHICAGFYAGRSHRVVPCPACALQPAVLTQILQTICSLLEQFKVSVYEEEKHTGLVRHIYLRHAVSSGHVMVCFVVNGTKLPHSEEIVQTLVQRHPETETVVLNSNTARTNVILGEQCTALYGDGTLRDKMCGVPVKLHPLSFYQVNTRAAEQLYLTAAKLAALCPDETLLDLYCGAGTIGLSMAHSCKKLIGVEIVPAAIESAKQNAAAMGIKHARFMCADAGTAAQKLLEEGLAPDVIVLDPPRKGCDDSTLNTVLAMAPSRIVMISCNAATAARDVQKMVQSGCYTVQAIQPADLFPRTKHVETIVLLSKRT